MSAAGGLTLLRTKNGPQALVSLVGRPHLVWTGERFEEVRVVRYAFQEKLLTFYFSNGMIIEVPKRAAMTIVDEETQALVGIQAGNAKIGMRLAPMTDQDGNEIDVFISSIKDKDVKDYAYDLIGSSPVPFQILLSEQKAEAPTQ